MPNENMPVVDILTADHDRHNIEYITKACESGRINDETAEYLRQLYSDGMDCYRDVFHVLGKCFGAPKTAVTEYDPATDLAVKKNIKIVDINPLCSYIVNHSLDADPMRNQFFTLGTSHKVDLSVSSIVTVIVAAEKNVERALEKITGKYYQSFVDTIIATVSDIISGVRDDADEILANIRSHFTNNYFTDASEQVLSLIPDADNKLVADLVRGLDKIDKPYSHLNDVWRVKCLFDLIPQARTFIERLRDMMPERIISVRDKFYDITNPRNHRDSKVIINIGTPNKIIPLEIICQVRIFFEFERQTHDYYATLRENPDMIDAAIEQKAAELMENGIEHYNIMICRYLDDLLERVGWNILYGRSNEVSLFEGFPRECKLYYPRGIVENIMNKLDAAVQNEVFSITNSSSKLDKAQEIAIFRFMARFVLVSAMPYAHVGGKVSGDTLAVRLFNFVLNEILRYYKNERRQ